MSVVTLIGVFCSGLTYPGGHAVENKCREHSPATSNGLDTWVPVRVPDPVKRDPAARMVVRRTDPPAGTP